MNNQKMDKLEAYNQLFEHSFDAICFMDANFHITKANNSFLKLFKISEFEKLDFNTLIFKGSSQDSVSTWLDDQDTINLSSKLRTLNGDLIQAKVFVSKIISDSKETYLVVIHDKTKLEQAKLKIHDTEKNDLIQRMARIIGHEIRNPLTNIDLAVDDLKLDHEENEEVSFMLDLILRNSNRISVLIDNFLLNTKHNVIKLKEGIIENVISAALKKCEDRIILKQIDLTTTGLDSKTKTLLDHQKLEIVFTNVIINATEALERTTNPQIKIDLISVENHLVLKISDNGEGMTDAVKDNLFKPFYSTKQGGLGLGMSNAKHILYKHNAYFDVESETGKGTVFVIVFNAILDQ